MMARNMPLPRLRVIRTHVLVPIVASLGAGCTANVAEPAGVTSTLPACADGQVDDSGTCVPEACGTGTWGNLAVDDATVYVQAGASGDGTAARPLGSIQAAVDLAGARGGGSVAVAAGTYAENVVMGIENDAVRVQGRCAALVHIDGSHEETQPTVLVAGARRRPTASFAGLTLESGTFGGAWFERADVTLSDSVVVSNAAVGIFVTEEAEVVAQGVDVIDTRPDNRGRYGRGLEVTDGGHLVLRHGTVVRSQTAGAFVHGLGAELEIEDASITDTLPSSAPTDGHALLAREGGRIVGARLHLAGNRAASVYALEPDSRIELADTVVEGTLPDGSNELGHGLVVQAGASILAVRTEVLDSPADGVTVEDEGSHLVLEDSVVRGSRPTSDETYAIGVSVSGGATAELVRSVIEDNTNVGVYVGDAGSLARLDGTEVRATRPSPEGERGYGAYAVEGGTLEIVSSILADNVGIGVGVAGGASRAELDDTQVLRTRPDNFGSGRGIDVMEGNAVLVGTTIEDSVEAGVLVSAGGALEMRDSEVRGTLPTTNGLDGRGVVVQNGAQGTFRGVRLVGNRGVGLFVANADSHVMLDDVAVTDTRRDRNAAFAVGIVSERGAELRATALEVTGTEGPGVYVNTGGTARLESSVLRGNAFVGALVAYDGVLSLRDSRVEDTQPDASRGGGFGVLAAGDARDGTTPALALSRTSIGPHPYAAVWLDGPGSYVIEDSDLAGSPGVRLGTWSAHGNAVFARGGIAAWDGRSGLYLARTTIHDARREGILLDDASAAFSAMTWRDTPVTVWQQRCEQVPPIVDPPADSTTCTSGTLLVDEGFTLDTIFLPEVDPG